MRPNGLDDTPAAAPRRRPGQAPARSGLSLADVNATLSAAWGGAFINNFIDRGRVKRVYMQGDAPYRMPAGGPGPAGTCAASTGTMAPFSSFATAALDLRARRGSSRYNGLPAIEIQGAAGAGHQLRHGDAARWTSWSSSCPTGVGFELDRACPIRRSVSGAQAPALYALSILVVFLCLAALYESWSIPLSVMLVIPLGVVGAVLAATLRGLYNDIYFQVGLLTTIGLSAKNAILIVEFAEDGEAARHERRARRPWQAARLRLRPILMTSLAFVAGVCPLAIVHRRRRGQPERHRHRRDRRHDVGHRAWRSSSSRCSS